MSVKSLMPVGYRFHPTDQELVNHYLRLKNQGSDRHVSNIQEIDVCKWEPWELPGRLGSESDDQEWYFFGRRDSKYGKSSRSNRATKEGYWKPTGKDRYIKTSSKKVIGTKKTLVFYKGRAQRAVRTYWVMHEYRASVDKHNPQAFVLYLLKKKSEENSELSNSDGVDPRSSISSTLLNNAPYHSPSTPTVLQGSGNLSSSDQTRFSQNWKEQEVSSHAQNYPSDSTYLEDDIDLQVFENCFDGQQPTWEGLERMLPAIPLADVYPNQGPVHLTARYLNVSSSRGPGVTQFQNTKRFTEAVSNIDNVSSIFLQPPEPVPLDAESGTETDNEAPQSLFDEDAVYGGSAYHSDSESSDPEFYNDTILAQDASLPAENSDVIRHVDLEADREDSKKLTFSGRVHELAENKSRKREVPAEAASGDEEYSKVPENKSESKILERGSGDFTVESLNSGKMCFIIYAENHRVNNGTTPASSYITNIAIGVFLILAIAGEVLFGLVS
ncbi:unnamed protein product [Rhodiola kirilowii]